MNSINFHKSASRVYVKDDPDDLSRLRDERIPPFLRTSAAGRFGAAVAVRQHAARVKVKVRCRVCTCAAARVIKCNARESPVTDRDVSNGAKEEEAAEDDTRVHAR